MTEDKIIWETRNFDVIVVGEPFISREEGGHMIIAGKGNKYRYNSRLDFSPVEALEEQRLSQMLSEAYTKAMKKRNIDIIRINYFEAGNWAWKKDENGNNIDIPFYHEHVFGRTENAVFQKFPDAPYLPDKKSGFYDNFKPLDEDDINCIVEEMEKLENEPKYNIDKWSIIQMFN